jgi:GNAT superfamily N-acetyltransferase
LNRARSRGPGEILGLAAGRLRDWWSSEDELIMLVRRAEPVDRPADDLSFRRAGAGDAHLYARDIGTDSASTFAGRLSDDVACFVVESGGRLLHSSWVTTSCAYTREIRANLCPPVGDCYVYESFTRADARGRGVYPFALAGIVSWAAAEGLAHVWVAVEADNEPSRRAIDKVGFAEAFVLPYHRRRGRLAVGDISGPREASGRAFVHPRPDRHGG